jgi:cell division protein FtsB
MDDQFYRKEKRRSRGRTVIGRILRNRRLLLILIVGIPLAVFLLFSNRGIVQRVRLERQKTEMEEQIRVAGEETRRLQAESKALDGDRTAIEKVAREKYGMVREGEKVYKIDRAQ